jgi:hypothetical protein
MKYVQTYKAIRIDSQTLEKLKDVNYLLNTISLELEGLAGEDKNYKDIADAAWHASAALDDFLTAYQDEVTCN